MDWRSTGKQWDRQWLSSSGKRSSSRRRLKLSFLISNAYIRNLHQRSELLTSPESLGIFEHYRKSINYGVSYGHFMLDVCPNLVRYTDKISTIEEFDQESEETSINTEEWQRIRNLILQSKRYRTGFFNSPDGVRVQLNEQPHTHRHTSESKHCNLCEYGLDRRQSKFKCATCGVHLYIRVQQGRRTSCWAKWHEAKRLEKVPLNEYETRNAKRGYKNTPESEPEAQESWRKLCEVMCLSIRQFWSLKLQQHDTGSFSPIGSKVYFTRSTRLLKRASTLQNISSGSRISRAQKVTRKDDTTNGNTEVVPPVGEADGDRLPCASLCGRHPFMSPTSSAHVCQTYQNPMHAYCIHAQGGGLVGGEEYERYGEKGIPLCKPCSLKNNVQSKPKCN